MLHILSFGIHMRKQPLSILASLLLCLLPLYLSYPISQSHPRPSNQSTLTSSSGLTSPIIPDHNSRTAPTTSIIIFWPYPPVSIIFLPSLCRITLHAHWKILFIIIQNSSLQISLHLHPFCHIYLKASVTPPAFSQTVPNQLCNSRYIEKTTTQLRWYIFRQH